MKNLFAKRNIFRSAAIFALGIIAAGFSIDTIHAEESPEAVVKEYVYAMDAQDWDKFANLHCSEEKESLDQFFSNPENEIEHTGVLNVEHASLVDLVEVNLDDVSDMLYKEYDSNNSKIFVFGVDYDVYGDSKYYSSGINYNFITCVKEEGNWKIYEMLPIENPRKLADDGYKFNDSFSMAVHVMDARQNGYFVNYNGDVFDCLDEDMNGIESYAVVNNRTVPTKNTKIRLKKQDGSIDKNLLFHDYCLGVLAGELREAKFDGQVRRAQAIAIKTFTWHYLIIPHGATEGYDLNYEQQSYVPSKISENSKVTDDYNAVKNVWMESHSGAIFIAYYKKGAEKDQEDFRHKGEFKQLGALWLYKNNKATTYKSLLKYYYDSSSASTGGAIRFFDNNKNEL